MGMLTIPIAITTTKNMKKISIYMMALLSIGLMACNGDYDPEVGPQSNPQESILNVSDIAVNSAKAPQAVSIADFINAQTGAQTPIHIGDISVKKGAMPINTIFKACVEFSLKKDFSDKISVNAASLADTTAICVSPDELQKAYFNKITHNPKKTDLYVRTILYTVTAGSSEVRIGQPDVTYFDTHKISFTPADMGLKISEAYYLVGGPKDWNASATAKEMKFEHSDIDVYDDPVFTIVVPAAASGDTQFAFGDAEALDAASNGDWSKVFGVAEKLTDLTGKFDTRKNLGSKNPFSVPEGCNEIKVSVNMADHTYEITPLYAGAIIPDPILYLTGDHYGWGATWVPLVPIHSHPTMSWVIKYLHKGEEFKFAPQPNWSNDFGTSATITDNAGMNPSDNGGNIVTGNAGWYLIKVDNTPGARTIEFQKPNIYLFGNTSPAGWSAKPEGLFTIPEMENGQFVSPTFIADDEVRMCVKFDGIDWWQTEFIVNAKGQLDFRGAGGDQARVKVTKGKKTYLNFTTLSGSYK